MRQTDRTTFPLLRRTYGSAAELGGIINRGRDAIFKRLKGDVPFTAREKELILNDLIRKGLETEKNPETYKKYFPEVA